jgi:hypothetical protein
MINNGIRILVFKLERRWQNSLQGFTSAVSMQLQAHPLTGDWLLHFIITFLTRLPTRALTHCLLTSPFRYPLLRLDICLLTIYYVSVTTALPGLIYPNCSPRCFEYSLDYSIASIQEEFGFPTCADQRTEGFLVALLI